MLPAAELGIAIPLDILTAICTILPLSALNSLASANKILQRVVNTELYNWVKRIVSLYLDHNINTFILLINRLQGVFTRLTFLNFMNGNNPGLRLQRMESDSSSDNLPFLEIVVKSSAIEEIVNFFNSFQDDMLKISVITNVGRMLQASGACDTVFTIDHMNVRTATNPCLYSKKQKYEQRNIGIKLYATSHHSIFPFIIEQNMTALASGFTHTACFTFFPTHVLDKKICIGGKKFKNYLTADECLTMTAVLNSRGYKLSMAYISAATSKGHVCPRRRRRVNDSEGTFFLSWGGTDDNREDLVLTSMKKTQYT